ncbi:MAG: NB-ARC domain-containing protein, partial [Synechococcales bacterium]|nr:NB-ARC domain-containing protein [Synechococcales bacterium]
MTPEDALNIVNAVLQGDRLNSLQRQVFCKAWADQSYVQIAQECGYELGYVKQVGAEVWQRLSTALHTKVTKKNLHRILHQRAIAPTPPPKSTHSPTHPSTHPPPPTHSPTCDWGAAVDATHFLGRDSELTHLRQWILDERCRLIGVVGMGGMGKTTLAAYLARQIQPHFDYVVWRSLRNAPPLEDLLEDLLQFFGGQTPVRPAATPDGRLHQLLAKLRQHRCLVVLDNCETILQQGSHGGHYLPGYAAYGQLWQCLGESAHQSTVLITSREKPREMAALEGVRLPVRSLTLNGLPPHLGRELFACKGDFCGSAATWELLVNHYAGNPLALKMVAVVVRDWFGGELERFLTCLQEGTSVFGDIQDLLAQQIDRLSPLEQQILDWLAIARTPLTLSQLRRCFLPGVPLGHLLAALTSLERRCLMDKTPPTPQGNRQICFTLQPVVMAFVTERFIQRIHGELQARVWNGVEAEQPRPRLMSHALIQTQTADHIRETQTRLILAPIVNQLRQQQSESALVALFQDCVRALRERSPHHAGALSPDWIGYAVGNGINLLRELDLDLSGWDFSRLPIRNANLRGLSLRGVNFTGADLSQSIFTETFGQVLSVAFSPDSTLLAAGDVNQEIHLWQVATGKKLLTLRVDEGWVWDVAFSPDGQTLATAANRSVKLWQVQTGACLTSFTDYPDRVFSVSFSPDGNYLATGGEDHLIRVWCVRTGTLRWVLAGHEDEVRSVAFSPPFALSASRSG